MAAYVEQTPGLGAALAAVPQHLDLFYGGQWHAARGGRRPTIDPSRAEVITEVADANEADADAAVAAAHAAFPAWRRLKPIERAARLREAAAVLRAHAEELALLDALNTGNPVAEMMGDALVAAGSLEYYAGLAHEVKGSTLPMGDLNLNYTVREPLGVVARIVAYNHPLMFAGTKIGAPLAAGNCVIVKAPEQAPLSCLRLAELIGHLFPPGVLNILAGGRECGQALAAHRLVRKVTLIGSVPTGKAVMRTASDTLKSVLLELGGKNALIVYPDADLDKATAGAVRGMNFTWAGQSCGSTSRVFLHESVHDLVLDGIVRLAQERHCPGAPTDRRTTMGPLVSGAHFDKVMGFIESAHQEGARLMCGGGRPREEALARGYFIEPTIFADVKPHMRIASEEVFGPVLSVLKWRDEDELFEQVNGVEYGLTCSIWTRDLKTAHDAARRAEAGYVWVNNASQHFLGAPFGGVKQSGIGREEGIEELFEFTELKNVNLQF